MVVAVAVADALTMLLIFVSNNEQLALSEHA